MEPALVTESVVRTKELTGGVLASQYEWAEAQRLINPERWKAIYGTLAIVSTAARVISRC